jgi:hypothetical protein
MGLDGGTYITRSDVLRGQSWAVTQADGTRSTRGGAVGDAQVFKRPSLAPAAAREVRWSTCFLSGEPLAAPVVADDAGALYNKEALLEYLLARQGNPADAAAAHRYLNQIRASQGAYDHLASTRDVFAVHLDGATAAEPYRCPVSGLSCLAARFSALASCGHVLSDRAVAAAQSQAAAVAPDEAEPEPEGAGGRRARCAVCDQPFSEEDVVRVACGGEEGATEGRRRRERGEKGRTRRAQKQRRKRAREAGGEASGS